MAPLPSKRVGLGLLSTILLSLLVIARKRRMRYRRYGVRPFLKHNKKHGQYEKLLTYMMKNDEEEFFSYTRMSPRVFKYLLSLLEPHTLAERMLTLQFRLVLTLHYLAEGMTMGEIARNFVIGRSSVHYVTKETCEVIWKVLMPIYLPPPTTARFESIEKEFCKRWNIPNCIGAVDGKHVPIQAPAHTGTDYFSYKKSFSLVLMAVCDSFYKFCVGSHWSPGITP